MLTTQLYLHRFKNKNMENDTNRPVHTSQKGRLIFGAILIVIGGIVLLGNLDFFNVDLSFYLFSWKTILIYIGIYLLAARPQSYSGYILMGLGFIFWIPNIFGENISLHEVFWPLVLIGLGILLITRQRNRHHEKRQNNKKGYSDNKGYLNDISVFGGGIKIIQSDNFKGGSITAVFGGSEIDLRQVSMEEDFIVIDVFTMFGGTKLILPENWKVEWDGVSLFGGFSDKRRINTGVVTEKTLVIKGLVMFGGIEVKSY